MTAVTQMRRMRAVQRCKTASLCSTRLVIPDLHSKCDDGADNHQAGMLRGGMSRKACIFVVLLLSVQVAAQTGPVVQNPTADQQIIQPPGTTFSTNNEAGILYPAKGPLGTRGPYDWQQSPSVGLTGGMQSTLNLSSCPAGLVAPFTRIYITDTNDPSKSEAVALSTATSPCPLQGGGSGNITFTPANSHTGGHYNIGSASQGIQEAINAANSVSTNFPNQLGKVIIPPGDYTAKARVSILGSKQYIDANGAVLTCTMADTCVFVGDTASANTTWDVTIDGLAVRPGYPTGAISPAKFSAIEDNGQHTTLRGIVTRDPSSSLPVFFSIIQIDNDQSAVIEKLDPSQMQGRGWTHCGTDWCSVAIFAPGPFGTNAGVLWVKDSNISGQCFFNGIDNQDANALRVSDTVVQGYPQFGIRATGSFNNVAALLDNVHLEVGSCTNPLGVGIAGFISEGFFSVLHGTGSAGLPPQFFNTGTGTINTIYAYYIVVNSSVGTTVSAPYLAGYASFLSGPVFPITVKWPQVGTTGTITYDLVRTTVLDTAHMINNQNAPYGSNNFAVKTGIQQSANCSNKVCSFVDTGSGGTNNYPVMYPSTYAPALTFWPGSVVLTAATDSPINNGGEPRLYTDMAGQTGIGVGGYVNSYGANVPTVFADQCSVPGAWSSIWMSCAAGDSVSGNYPPVGALVLQAGPTANTGLGGFKGRLNFLTPSNTSAATHLITLGDSNSAKTLATPGHRPTNDASDTWIGLDNLNANTSGFQLAFGAPVSISSYIGNIGDNNNWLERLTNTPSLLKSFRVPITTNSQISSTVAQGTAPFQVTSSTPVQHLTADNNPTIQSCGTTNVCSPTSPVPTSQIVFGTLQLLNGSKSLTGISPPFRSATSFNCVANDVTNQANGVNAVPISGSSVSFTGTGTDTVSYQCVGSE